MTTLRKKFFVILLVIWAGSFVTGAVSTRFQQYVRDRSRPKGLSEYEEIQDMLAARLYDEVISRGRNVFDHGQQGDYGPRILFACWRASESLDRANEASWFRSEFLRRYPQDPIGADLSFAIARSEISAGNFKAARVELGTLIARYPQAVVRPFADALLEQIHGAADDRIPVGTE
jgi:hypothetical protein